MLSNNYRFSKKGMFFVQMGEHYLRLRAALPSRVEEQEVSVEEIAECLCCTPRNVRFLLKGMQEADWIDWVPGRGRGRRSAIAFRKPIKDVLLGIVEEFVQKGNLSDALALVQQHMPDGRGREQFVSEWLLPHLGYASEAGTEEEGDKLRYPIPTAMSTLDPAYLSLAYESHLIRQIFNGLVLYNEQTERIEGQLAHHWESNDERTVWTFWLRKGVQFHNGHRLSAEDVVHTLNRLRDRQRKTSYRWAFAQIHEVRALNRLLVQIELDEPNHAFLHLLSTEHASIVPSDGSGERENFGKLPVGTGPFSVTRNDESMVVLEAFDGYWGHRAHLDRIELWVIPNIRQLSTVQEVGGQQVNYIPYQWSGKQPDWNSQERLDASTRYLMFNMNKSGPHLHPSFRRSVRLIVDAWRMVEELGQHRQRPARQFRETGEPVRTAVNETEISRLLKECGYRGEAVKLFGFHNFSNPNDTRWIQERCKQHGIEIEVTLMPVLEFNRRRLEADLIHTVWVYSRNLEISLLGLYRNADSDIHSLLDPQLRQSVDRSVDDMWREPDRAERLRLIQEMGDVLIDQHCLLPLYHTRQERHYPASLQGMLGNPHDGVLYKDLWFKEKGGSP